MSKWMGSRMQVGPAWFRILLLAGVLGIGLVAARQFWVSTLPQTVIQEYVAAVYARDYSQAYEFISEMDKNIIKRAEVPDFYVHYEFYPIDSFPED